MSAKKDTLLLLTGLTDSQADSIVKYICRQQENDRFPECQARKHYRSELDSTLAGFHTLRIYGLGDES